MYFDERIKPGCLLYRIESSDILANEMTTEQKKEHITQITPSIVQEVSFMNLQAMDKIIPFDELYYYYIIQTESGEIISSYDLRKRVESLKEGYFDFNPSAVNSFIHSGMSFIFEEEGIYSLSDEEKLAKERFPVPKVDLYLGMSFNGLHYEIEDFFIHFLFFKEDGSEVDLSMLKYLYIKQRPLFLYKGLCKEGIQVYSNDSEKLSHQLTNDEKKKIVSSQSPLKVIDVSDNHILAENDYIRGTDIYYFYILTDDKGNIIDSERILNHLSYIAPNLFNFSVERVEQFIRKGMTYIFDPSGWENLSEEDEKTRTRYIVKNKYAINGISSNGGFLDASDMLYNCIFFDENGEKVDLSELRKAYASCYQIPIKI